MSTFHARSASEDQLLTLQFDQFCENEEEMCSAVFANSMVVRQQRYCSLPHARQIDRLKLLSSARQIDRLKLLSVSRLQIQARQIDRLKLLTLKLDSQRWKARQISQTETLERCETDRQNETPEHNPPYSK